MDYVPELEPRAGVVLVLLVQVDVVELCDELQSVSHLVE